MQIGKEIRLDRILNRQTNKTVIVPMDHGVTMGPIEGLISISTAANQIAEGGVSFFQIIIPVALGDVVRPAGVIFFAGYPDAAVVAQRLTHQG